MCRQKCIATMCFWWIHGAIKVMGQKMFLPLKCHSVILLHGAPSGPRAFNPPTSPSVSGVINWCLWDGPPAACDALFKIQFLTTRWQIRATSAHCSNLLSRRRGVKHTRTQTRTHTVESAARSSVITGNHRLCFSSTCKANVTCCPGHHHVATMMWRPFVMAAQQKVSLSWLS